MPRTAASPAATPVETKPAVVFLQGSSGFGGSKRSLLHLLEALRGTAWQPVVACPERGWLTEQLDQQQVPHRLVPFHAWRKWLERPRLGSSIRKQWLPALQLWRVALVHSNEFWWAPHAIELARRLEVPAMVHLRDGHHTLRKARQYRLDKAARVLAVSTELREQFTQEANLYQKTTLLFNGHDELVGDRDAARAKWGVKPADFVIGNAGKLCDRKNQRLLLKAAAWLKQQRRLANFKVLFAGEAEPAYEQILRADIQELGLQQEVQLLGAVSDMGAFYAAIDLLVHCARREGLPRVLPEAMLARRAVVATAAEGVRDAIPDERFGAVLPAEDEVALAAQIERLSQDAGLRATVCAQAYDRARSLFGQEAFRHNLLRLYGAILAGQTRAAV